MPSRSLTTGLTARASPSRWPHSRNRSLVSYPGPPEVTQASLPAPRSGGTEGNERLTAMTGAVLLILLTV